VFRKIALVRPERSHAQPGPLRLCRKYRTRLMQTTEGSRTSPEIPLPWRETTASFCSDWTPECGA